MAAVAKPGRGCVLASAEVNRFGLGGIVLHGREFATLVVAIAEGLVGAEAAGTPVVALTGLDFNGKGTFLGNRGFGHREVLLERYGAYGYGAIIADTGQRVQAPG